MKTYHALKTSIFAFFTLFLVISIQAQSVVYLAPQTGSDANPCAIIAPCRSLATAHTNVPANGKILIVESGELANLTITKAVTIETLPSITVTLISPFASPIINVSAGSTDKVVLRGLSVKGTSTTNIHGIAFFTGASLLLDNCYVEGFNTAGIAVNNSTSGSFALHNTTLRHNGTGISLSTLTGQTQLSVIEQCVIEKNSSSGINAAAADNATLLLNVRNTRLEYNTGSGIRVISAFTNSFADVSIDNVTLFGNSLIGIKAERTGTTVRVSNSTIQANSTGVGASTGASILSRSNNTVEGNTNNGAFTGTYTAK